MSKIDSKQTMEAVGGQVAEITIAYSGVVRPADRVQIRGSRDCEEILRKNWTPGTMELCESFYVIMLNRANKVIGIYKASQGGVSGTVVDAKLVFATALKSAASQIILAHNHPSGALNPSESDIQLTRKLVQAGKVLDLQVLDHIIMTETSYYSFADEGAMNF